MSPRSAVCHPSSSQYSAGMDFLSAPHTDERFVYCKFGNFRHGFIFAKTLQMRSFVKMKPSRSGEITLSIY